MTHEAKVEAVVLNGTTYAVTDGVVVTSKLNAWADPLRIVGNQQRGDRVNSNQWVMEDWSSGLGYRTMKGSPNADPLHPSFSGFFDSSVETRWSGQVTLPGWKDAILWNGGENLADDFNLLMLAQDGNGVIPHLIPTDLSSEISEVSFSAEDINVAHAYTITNFEPRDFIQVLGDWYIMGGRVVNNTVTAGLKLDQAGTWSTYTPATTNTTLPVVSLAYFRDIPYAATIDSVALTVQIEKSTAGNMDNWAPITGLRESVGDTRTANLVVYKDAQGAPALYLQTDYALYLVDLANSQLEPVITFGSLLLQGSSPNNVTPGDYGLPPRPVVWGGDLYIPRGPSLIKFNFAQGDEEISPLVTKQIPSNMASADFSPFISAIHESEGWLYVAFNGDTRSTIWAYDGKGFHFVYERDGSGNTVRILDFALGKGVTSTDLHVDALWVLWHDAGDTDHRNIDKVLYISQDPISSTAKKFESSGKLITPWFDGGMTEVDGVVLGLGFGAEGLDTTANVQERIITKLGINYATGFANTITLYSDSDPIEKYGSGAGVSARSRRYEFELVGISNLTTPTLYYPISYYEKVFPDLHSYEFSVDISKTIQMNQGQGKLTDAQQVLDSLDDINSTIPLVSFKYVGTTLFTNATRYVRMVNAPAVHVIKGNPSSHSPGISDGGVRVRLEERL